MHLQFLKLVSLLPRVALFTNRPKLLNGVKLRRIRRQIYALVASTLNKTLDVLMLMNRSIVHNQIMMFKFLMTVHYVQNTTDKIEVMSSNCTVVTAHF
ncbi:unnamed protein product [Rhizopus stolonifer]